MTFTLENYLSSLHQGQWFGFDGDKTYANVIVHDNSKTLPTEAECIDGIQAMQDEYDNAHLEYKLNRMKEYPSIGEQLDMQYHDLVNGTTTWKDAIAKVKADNPKPE